MIPVLISIEASAWREDMPDAGSMQIMVPGEMELHPECAEAVLRYEETIDEEAAPQHVTVTVRDHAVSVVQDGDYETQMYFKKDFRYQSVYSTPAGDMDMCIFCTSLDEKLDASGGTIHIHYQLDLNGKFAAMHEMKMQVMPANNGVWKH